MVLLGDLVETSEVHAQVEGAVFLLDEEHWCSVRGCSRLNKTESKVLINEFPESLKLGRG